MGGGVINHILGGGMSPRARLYEKWITLSSGYPVDKDLLVVQSKLRTRQFYPPDRDLSAG